MKARRNGGRRYRVPARACLHAARSKHPRKASEEHGRKPHARPRPPPQRRDNTQPTRLQTTLRTEFRRARIYREDLAEFDRHRVVSHYPIDADGGTCTADFALRNGMLRITERPSTSVDRSRLRSDKTLRAALKCLTLDNAMKRFKGDCASSVVFMANADTMDVISVALTLLGNYAERVYDFGLIQPDRADCFTMMMQKAAGALA